MLSTEDLLRESDTKVKLLHEEPCRHAARTVKAYCRVDNRDRTEALDVRVPVFFDKVVVAVVDGLSTAPPAHFFWSYRPSEMLRSVYHLAMRTVPKVLPPPISDQPILDLRGVSPNNMAHLMVDLIPMILHARNVLGAFPRVILDKARGPFAQLLEVFGVETRSSLRDLRGPIVHIRGTRYLQFYDLPKIDDCPGVSFFPGIYNRYEFRGHNVPERIFLARRGSRALSNGAEVAQMLGERGFVTVYMEDYSVPEQLSIAQNAKHVVAIHGAAMGLLLVNKSIESLIEIFPPHVYHDCFAISLPQVKRYSIMVQNFDRRIPNLGWNAISHFKDAPFAVDLGILERILDDA